MSINLGAPNIPTGDGFLVKDSIWPLKINLIHLTKQHRMNLYIFKNKILLKK